MKSLPPRLHLKSRHPQGRDLRTHTLSSSPGRSVAQISQKALLEELALKGGYASESPKKMVENAGSWALLLTFSDSAEQS